MADVQSHKENEQAEESFLTGEESSSAGCSTSLNITCCRTDRNNAFIGIFNPPLNLKESSTLPNETAHTNI
jgi:hypothetical protein